eukprot:CAMPEP_0119536560 /NCGR_PEP_ID=MMETSP1344-20130328/49379_1 /TAXON_ID=236787 /ORGANISM="Florenciella parvula, Strain CCMP2471" /LENGTH=34 /DNA_ID= /DNA_START= /DNA_END= /DNA_ORIENTATION=
MTSFVSSDCFGKGLVSGGTKGGSFDVTSSSALTS